MRHLLLPCLLVVAAAGCRDRSTARTSWPTARTRCPAPTGAARPWRHTGSRLTSRLGDPVHVADDVVVAAGAEPAVRGKFAYGAVSKDLEDEAVDLYVGSSACDARRVASAATDDDGRVTVRAGRLASGFHRYWLVVGGDLTAAEAGVWVLPGPTPAVVFDVDGTLTVDDGELLDDLLGRDAQVRAGAVEVVERWAAKGYLVVYLTGRPYPLRDRTRGWLDHHHFPYGPLFTPDHLTDGLPTEDRVGAYKQAVLEQLIAAGLRVTRAYGNAHTDVCAYARAGVAPEVTYIVGTPTPCAGHAAPHALAGYVDHLAEVDAQPAAAIP